MSDQEIYEYCGHICMAAAVMGILIHESNPTDNGTQFQWMDHMTRVFIKGPYDKDRKKALFSACESLTKYLNPVK